MYNVYCVLLKYGHVYINFKYIFDSSTHICMAICIDVEIFVLVHFALDSINAILLILLSNSVLFYLQGFKKNKGWGRPCLLPDFIINNDFILLIILCFLICRLKIWLPPKPQKNVCEESCLFRRYKFSVKVGTIIRKFYFLNK